MSKLWYKNAVIYSVDVAKFLDSDGNGVGDFNGLKHRLPYLVSLGINCIWLLPFYDSPNLDNGYDVRNFYQIDSRVGDFGTFVEFVDAAAEMGIRILVDLVANHTSTEHPWFQEARNGKSSKYYDYYIWSKKKPKKPNDEVMFGKEQGNSNWKYDQKTKAYFYHTFYGHQPDLNMTNPAVQKEIMRIMHFWLKLGISGFRIDATEHIIREKGGKKFQNDPHEVFRTFHKFVENHRKDAILLAEVDTEPEKYQSFFGKEDQMYMLFNFYLNNYTWLALAEKSPKPLIKALKKLPKFSKKEQMAVFLRNHDELTLERLTDKERQKVFTEFAPEENMRIYGRGIRRRAAPMLKNQREQMELAYSLMFTLPGTPVLRYGQEIGMGDDLSLKERNSVRTVMQWSDSKNAGFTDAQTLNKEYSLISEGEFGYTKTNVNDQKRDSNSLLNWTIRAANIRKECPEFGWGKYHLLETNSKDVLAIHYETDEGMAVALHNFSEEKQTVQIHLKNTENLLDVFGNKKYKKFDQKKQILELSAYGYRWLRKINAMV